MDADEFRKNGKQMVDYVADYLENIRDRRALSNVEPGYLRKLIPDHAPEEGEKWEDLFQDIERVIMPGVTHWQNPQFYGYFVTGNSYPAILADMLADAIACTGFSWSCSPACTELEVAMMDWLGKMIQLPEDFLSGGKGGGVIQSAASEATLVGLLAARNKAIAAAKKADPDLEDGVIISKLVAYGSDQAHCSVERAALLGAVKYHSVKTDDEESLRGDALEQAMAEDRAKGLTPFYVVATLGTTPTCAFDNIKEIGPLCEKEDIWMHIDAAYAGSAFICPEFRPMLDGVEFAQSFNFNPHKWLLVNFDCSGLWFKDASYFVDNYKMDPLYLRHVHDGKVPDLRHWQIPFGRRFRSLKLWFVLRMYGVKGLQEYIRKHVKLAHRFEDHVRKDSRFQVTHDVTMALVCFRMKGPNGVSKTLLHDLNEDGRIHLVAGESKGVYFLRLAVCASRTEDKDIDYAWSVVQELAGKLLEKQ